MNIKKRTCINCSSFNPAPAGEEPTCWNLVSVIDNYNTPQAVTREPLAADTGCTLHLSQQEDAQDKEFREAHREIGGFEGALLASRAIQEAHTRWNGLTKLHKT